MWAFGQIRNPKSEIRNKSEIRTTWDYAPFGLRDSDLFWTSDFGPRITILGLRSSDYTLSPFASRFLSLRSQYHATHTEIS
jgi:hypothetical protein